MTSGTEHQDLRRGLTQEDQSIRKLLSGDNTMGLFVSLYLILLAFFIMLQVASDQSMQKASDAVSSVQETFQFKDRDGTTAQSVSEDGGEASEADVDLQAIDGLFRDTFQVEGRFIPQGAGLLAFELPLEDLFQEGALSLRADKREWLRDLVQFCINDSAGRRMEVTILFGESGDRSITGDALSIRRASFMARSMAALGLPEDGAVVGMDDGSPDRVKLIVRPTPTDMPRADLIPWRFVQ